MEITTCISPKADSRVVWLDVVRLIAMFTVVCCHCTEGVVHLPQRVFNLGQAAVFDLPQAAAHLPVQGAAVGQVVARSRVGDNGGVQRKVGAAPVQGALAAADRLAEGDAVRTAGQQRVGGGRRVKRTRNMRNV